MIAAVYDTVAIARMFRYLREAQALGQNRGARIDGLILWALGELGQSWCDYYAIGFVLDVVFQGEGPFPRSQSINGSTIEALQFARDKGWVVDLADAIPGDLVFFVNAAGTPHHVGILVTVSPFVVIAGNTSEDGTSSNGDRVAEHVVSPANKILVQYPRTPTPGTP